MRKDTWVESRQLLWPKILLPMLTISYIFSWAPKVAWTWDSFPHNPQRFLLLHWLLNSYCPCPLWGARSPFHVLLRVFPYSSPRGAKILCISFLDWPPHSRNVLPSPAQSSLKRLYHSTNKYCSFLPPLRQSSAVFWSIRKENHAMKLEKHVPFPQPHFPFFSLHLL